MKCHDVIFSFLFFVKSDRCTIECRYNFWNINCYRTYRNQWSSLQEDIISRALAERVMATFDKVINKTLNTKAKNKMNFKVYGSPIVIDNWLF